MQKKLSNKKGITLVEVVVAVALVALVVTTVVVTVAQSAVNADKLDMIYTCSVLARKHMDSLKAMEFRDLFDRAQETNVRIDLHGDADSSGNYQRSSEVDEDWNNNSYLVKVKVSVDRIKDGKASGHPIVLETLFADAK